MEKYKSLADILIEKKNIENRGITFIENKTEVFVPYKELYHDALQILGSLQYKEIERGDKLILQIKDIKKFLYIFWACILGGIIPVPVTVGNNDEHKLKLFFIWDKLVNPYLITDEKNAEELKDFAAGNNPGVEIKDKKIILNNEIGDLLSPGNIYKSQLKDIAFIQFSSGSTGNSKGVILTHENLLTNIKQINKGANITKDDKLLNWMPLTHDMGIIGFHLLPVYNNLNQYIMPTKLFIRKPSLWMKKSSQHNITITGSPNFGYRHYLKFCNEKSLKNLDLRSIRLIVNGAEPISQEICYKFLNKLSDYGLREVAMCPVYGLAEASLAVSFTNPEEEIRALTINRDFLNTGQQIKYETDSLKQAITFIDVGVPLEGIKLRITDGSNNPLAEQTIGHIQIKGRNITSGYYNDTEKTRKVIKEGNWLDTGDLGFVRKRHLFITGRAKDVIFIHGQNYYFYDIERVSQQLEEIDLNEIAVSSIIDEREKKDKICCFVRYKKDLKSFIPLFIKLKKHIYKVMGLEVNYIIPIAKIPCTTSGKIKRYKLREMFEQGDFDNKLGQIKLLVSNKSETENKPTSELEVVLLNICEDFTDISGYGVNESITEYGIDSLVLSQIHERIDLLYPNTIKITDFYEYPSISQISSLIKIRSDFRNKGVKFPDIYYGGNGERDIFFEYTFNTKLVQDIRFINKKLKITPEDMFLAAYALLLKEISSQERIYLDILKVNSETINTLYIDFSSDFNSFKKFFKKLSQAKKHIESDKGYKIESLRKYLKNRERNKVYPLFIDSKEASKSYNILDIYSIVLEVNKGNDCFNFCLKFDSNYLKKDKMKVFFRQYIKLVEYITHNFVKADTKRNMSRKNLNIGF